MTNRTCIAAALLMTLAAARPARGEPTNYQNILVGERAMGMGGAFTALASDSSATYYNPAGLVQIDSASFTLQTSVYGFVGEALQGGKGSQAAPEELTVNTFNVIPTTLAIVKELYGGRETDGAYRVLAAVSLYLTDAVSLNRRRELEGVKVRINKRAATWDTYLELEQNKDETLMAGGSVGMAITPSLSVGLSVFVGYRTLLRQRNVTGALGAATFERLLTSADAMNLSLSFAAGVLYRPIPQLSVGLTLYTPNVEFYSSAALSVEQASSSAASIRVENLEDVAFRSPTPLRVTLGGAFQLPRVLTLSVDMTLYAPRDGYRDLDHELVGYDLGMGLTVNTNIGAEVYLLPWLPLRAGFFTNFSHDDDWAPEALHQVGVDMYGVTGSLGFEIKNTTFGFGALYNFGSGMTRGYDSAGVARGEVRRRLLMLMVSGSYNF